MTAINRIFGAFVGLSILLVPRPATAQGIFGGVHGGMGSTTLSNLRNAIDFGGPVDIERRTGVVIGPFIAFPMNETVALQVEALFVTKGATPTDGTNELKIRLAYVDVPVLLRLTRPSIQRFYFLLGPSFNVNIDAKTIDVIPTGVEQDIKDTIRNAELSVVVGAGVTVRSVLVEARYSAGLTDIVDDPDITAPVRNRGVAILVGVRF